MTADPRLQVGYHLCNSVILDHLENVHDINAFAMRRADDIGAVSGYIVEKHDTSRADWDEAGVTSQLTFTVVKLQEMHEYLFRVSAQNQYGVSEPVLSEPVVAKNPYSTSSDQYLFV